MKEFNDKDVRNQMTGVFESLAAKQNDLEEFAFRILNSADSVENLVREVNACLASVMEAENEEEREENLSRTENSLKNLALLALELNRYAHVNEETLNHQRETVEDLQQVTDYIISFL